MYNKPSVDQAANKLYFFVYKRSDNFILISIYETMFTYLLVLQHLLDVQVSNYTNSKLKHCMIIFRCDYFTLLQTIIGQTPNVKTQALTQKNETFTTVQV